MRSIKFNLPDNDLEVILSASFVITNPVTNELSVRQFGKYINGKEEFIIDETGDIQYYTPEKKGKKNAGRTS